MKSTLALGGAAVIGLAALAAVAATSGSADEKAVRDVVELYFKGHATGDGSYWKQAFHPDSKLFWIKEGHLAQRTSADFIAGAQGKPADDEARRKRRIALVDISGDAAVAKAELDYPGKHIVDYLSLLKVDGSWKIVNKVFTIENQ